MKPIVLFFEGGISVGKSTLLSIMEKHFPNYEIVYEPLDTWKSIKDNEGKNILDRFYNDMPKYAYAFQSTAFLSRVIRMKKALNTKKKIICIERSPYSDKNIFAKNCKNNGTMTDIEHKLYTEWFKWMEKFFDIPQKYFIYLKCNPEIAFKRIKERARPEEDGVTLEYLKTLHELHEKWLGDKDDSLILDANIDFKNDETNFGKLSAQVNEFIENIKNNNS